jgi:predicted dehydrogenase
MSDARQGSREPSAPVAVGVVGLGWWGRTLIAAIDDCPELNVIGAVVRSPDGVAWASERGLEVHVDLPALLEDSRAEAVIIATPNTVHCELSVMAAVAGRHVFCEKPLGLTREEAVATVEACRSAGVVLAVGHEIRFEPPVQEVLALARDGHLGQLVQFEAILSHDLFTTLPEDHWRLSLAEAPGGPLTATGIHMVDLSVALLGRPTSANAHLHRPGATGTLSILATYAGGAHALIGASAVTPFHMRLAVYGTGGWAEAAASPNPAGPGNVWTLTTSVGNVGRTTAEYLEERGIRDNLGAFAAAVRGRAAYPMSETEMVDTIALMEAIVRSADRGGATEAV